MLWAPIAINYLAGLAIANVALLGCFKYADCLVPTVNRLFGSGLPLPKILLPAAVSFATFLGLSYLIGCVPRARAHPQEPFRADHHWTFEAVYLGHAAIMQALGRPSLEPVDLDYTWPANKLVGSDNRLMGLATPADDHFEIGIPRDAVPYSLTLGPGDPAKGRRCHKLPNTVSISVSYEGVYQYRSSAEVVIETHRPELPDILVVGDSFKGPVGCLFYSGFDSTCTLDLRRFKDMSVGEYVQKYRPDHVVFLLSGMFFLESPWTQLESGSTD